MKESRREFAVNSPEQSTGPGQPQPRPYSFTFYLLLPYHPQSSTGGEGAASAISTASWAAPFPSTPLSPPTLPVIFMAPPTQSQQRRSQFLSCCVRALPITTIQAIQKELKIIDRGYHKRVLVHLAKYHELADAPRSGRPNKYTPDQLAQAVDWLHSLDRPCHSGRELVECLVEEGILPEGTPSGGFMPAFKAYVAEQGQQLKYGQRSMAFPLNHKQIKERLEWALKVQNVLTSASLQKWVFEDEISIDQGGHPKGEWCLDMHLNSLGRKWLLEHSRRSMPSQGSSHKQLQHACVTAHQSQLANQMLFVPWLALCC